MEWVAYRERIPKVLRVFIILIHVYSVFCLLMALRFAISDINSNDEYIIAAVALYSTELVFYGVSCWTLNSGLKKKRNRALLATGFLLWAAIAAGCCLFIWHGMEVFKGVVLSANLLLLFESLLLFLAYGCAKENEKGDSGNIIPKAIKTTTIVFFVISLVMSFVSAILMFCNKMIVIDASTQTPREEVWNGLIGSVPLAGFLILIVALVLFLSGCKGSNKAFRLSLLLIFGAQILLAIHPFVFLFDRTSISTIEGDVGMYISLMGGYYLAPVFFMILVSLSITKRAKKKGFLKMKSDERTTIRTGVFDYNKQNWWE